jgi:hypothetical protein
MKVTRFFAAGISILAGLASAAFGDAVVFSGAGTDAQVTTAIIQFRNALGPLNPNNPGSLGSGRREINWDDVPDSAAAPNPFPPDFFNANTPGRARGVVVRNLGGTFQVSADSENPTGTPPNFANVNPQFGDLFHPFSPQRLFSPDGFLTLVSFFIPGTSTPATVSGFGAVFVDVDLPDSASLTLLDAEFHELGMFRAPAANGGISFVGVLFNAGEQVAHVGILSGNVPIDGSHSEGEFEIFADAVVMDDFVYAEPLAQPSSCLGDVDRNGAVELADLSALLASFGTCIGGLGFNPAAELNGNGCVDLADLAILLAEFGSQCP